MKKNPLAFLAYQIEAHLPAPLRPVHAEIKSEVKKITQEQLSRFDLVPRAQFQALAQQIEQVQAQIAILESRLSALEASQSAKS